MQLNCKSLDVNVVLYHFEIITETLQESLFAANTIALGFFSDSCPKRSSSSFDTMSNAWKHCRRKCSFGEIDEYSHHRPVASCAVSDCSLRLTSPRGAVFAAWPCPHEPIVSKPKISDGLRFHRTSPAFESEEHVAHQHRRLLLQQQSHQKKGIEIGVFALSI